MFRHLLFLIIIISTADMKLQCHPGEITQPYIFKHNFIHKADKLDWGKDGKGIVSCLSLSCSILQKSDENTYNVTISSNFSTLTINVITTHSIGNYFSCYNDSQVSECFNCSMRVYAKPELVTCQDPEFQTETNEIAVVCTVQRVYPNPVCQFSWIIDSTEKSTVDTNLVNYNNSTAILTPGYFNQNCSFKIPARLFTSGKHQFQLIAYPNITGEDNDTVYGQSSKLTSPKSVVYPIITMKCTETTAQEGSKIMCSCEEIANTFILCNVTMFYGTETVKSAFRHLTANVTAKMNASELMCLAQLPDGTKTNKTIALRVFYPVKPERGPNVGGIVGGTVAAVLVIICVIVFVKRRNQIKRNRLAGRQEDWWLS